MLDGALVRRIAHSTFDDTYLMPYIDAASAVVIIKSPDHFKLTIGDTSGDYGCKETAGFVPERDEDRDQDDDDDRVSCEHCDDLFDSDDLRSGLCFTCRDESNVCHGCRGRSWDESGDTIADDWYCDDCASDRRSSCETKGCHADWYDGNRDDDDLRERKTFNVTAYCDDCASGKRLCPDCDTLIDRDLPCTDCEPCDDDGEPIPRPVHCDRTMPLPLAEPTPDPVTTFGDIAIGEAFTWYAVKDRAVKVSDRIIYWLGDDGRALFTVVGYDSMPVGRRIVTPAEVEFALAHYRASDYCPTAERTI